MAARARRRARLSVRDVRPGATARRRGGRDAQRARRPASGRAPVSLRRLAREGAEAPSLRRCAEPHGACQGHALRSPRARVRSQGHRARSRRRSARDSQPLTSGEGAPSDRPGQRRVGDDRAQPGGGPDRPRNAGVIHPESGSSPDRDSRRRASRFEWIHPTALRRHVRAAKGNARAHPSACAGPH